MNFDIVLVLGMHRSGTSAVTKGLETLGIDLGKNLLVPQPDNPKGFFEDRELVDINDQILAKSSSHWASLQFLEPEYLEDRILDLERTRARVWLENRVASGQKIGLKDPRLCRTLPFWKAIFQEYGLRVGHVMTHRHPLEIAHSLGRRNNFSRDYSIHLWASYLADCFRKNGSEIWICLSAQALMENPPQELHRLSDFLNGNWNPESGPIREFRENFLDPKIFYRQRELPETLPGPAVFGELLKIMEGTCHLSAGRLPENLGAVAQKVYQEIQGLSSLVQENNRFIDGRQVKKNEELIEATRLVSERTSWAQSLDRELEKERAASERQKAMLATKEEELSKIFAAKNSSETEKILQQLDKEKRAVGRLEELLAEQEKKFTNKIKSQERSEKNVVDRLRKLLLEQEKKFTDKIQSQEEKFAQERTFALEIIKQKTEALEILKVQAAAWANQQKMVDSLQVQLATDRIRLNEIWQIQSAEREYMEKSLQKFTERMDLTREEFRESLAGLVTEFHSVGGSLRENFGHELQMENQRISELGLYLSRVQDLAYSPWLNYLPAPFSWPFLLFKARGIPRPKWFRGSVPVKENKIGFWKKMERSFRKRRKRWWLGVGFSPVWYLQENPDVKAAGMDPLDHYIEYGRFEGRCKSRAQREKMEQKKFLNAKRLWSKKNRKELATLSQQACQANPPFPFDEFWYRQTYLRNQNEKLKPFEHYILRGAAAGNLPSPRFDPDVYGRANPGFKGQVIPEALHFLIEGHHGGFFTNWLDRYIEQNHDRSSRLRISSLLDMLLAAEDPDDPGEYRARKLQGLTERLVRALRGRPHSPARPRASIIIPVYNQVAYTLACVISLYESAPAVPFEVIIADDCSTDETREIFHQIYPEIRVIRTAGNFGFLRNCNHAAKTARGEFLVFLNNDMVVLPGWLDEMLETFALHPDCGMCGSKLLNLNGSLQEAGGIFWKDGSAWNYGRDQSPNLPEFNYVRRTDYCSGASLCLPQKHWQTLGGFDEIYERAYCEDADLSFRMRERLGLETYYQPFSVGVHLEGVTSGKDTAQGEKAYQTKNQKTFIARWRNVLEKDHQANGENVCQARGRTLHRKTVLVADHYIPEADKDAGSRTMSQIIELFSKKNIDVVLWPQNLLKSPHYAQKFQKKGIHVIYREDMNVSFEQWLSENRFLIKGFFIARPDVLIEMLPKIKKNSSARIFFYGMDIHHLRYETMLARDPKNEVFEAERRRYQKIEEEIWMEADVVFYPSQTETKFVEKMCKCKNIEVDARTLPVFGWSTFPDESSLSVAGRSGLLFVAGFNHPPNVNGLLWFIDAVFPLIQRQINGVKLCVAGSNAPSQVLQRAGNNIQMLGSVSEAKLEELYQSSRVAIAPLLSGAGMKGKVAEALKNGLPIVTTSFGAQGFEEENDLVPACDSPLDMAEKICSLLSNNNKWLEVARGSLRLAQKRFSEQKLWESIQDIALNEKK